MTVETDENGQLMVPHHDGNLLGVELEGEDCRLRYRSTDGMEREVRLIGVHGLDVSSFREGNIILDMVLIPAATAATEVDDYLSRRLGWGETYRIKGKFVFMLAPSYGAEVTADCEDVEVGEAAS